MKTVRNTELHIEMIESPVSIQKPVCMKECAEQLRTIVGNPHEFD